MKSILSAMCIVLATAPYAFANNGPAPHVMVLNLVVVVLIVVLTLAGGGNGVFARLQAAKYPSKVKRTLVSISEFIAVLVLFFIAIYFSIFGVAGFSIYAIARGVRMIRWAGEAEKNQPRAVHLEGVSPKRLKSAGIILIVLTPLVFGYSLFEEANGLVESRKLFYARMLNAEARNAYTAAKTFLKENPKAGVVTCADMEKAGYEPSNKEKITCFSDMTVSSGEIRLTGPESWGLKKPVAIITYSGELTPAKLY